MVFVVRSTDQTIVVQGHFYHGRSPDTPVYSKNASGLVSIPIKRGVSGDKSSLSKKG